MPYKFEKFHRIALNFLFFPLGAQKQTSTVNQVTRCCGMSYVKFNRL